MLDQENRLVKYQSIAESLSTTIAELKKTINQHSLMRLLCLAVEVVIFISFTSEVLPFGNLVWLVLFLIPIFFFILIVRRQQVLQYRETELSHLLWVYENEISVLLNARNGYDSGSSFEDETHAYTSDLDIFGNSSIYALINRCSTKIGLERLAFSLMQPYSKDQIIARQEAVREIVSQIDQTFEFRANLKNHDVNLIEQLKVKLKGPLIKQLDFVRGPFFKIYVRLLPYLIVILGCGAILGIDKCISILIVVAIFNAGLTFFFMKNINLVYYGFSGGSSTLKEFASAIKWTENNVWKSKYLLQLFDTDEKISLRIEGLAKIIQSFDARLNIIVASVLNLFLLWDIKCCVALAKWHQTSAVQIEHALSRIGEFEEIISAATFSYNQPAFCFPKITDHFCLNAENIGHPLIHETKKVANSFYNAEVPTVNIITGSNMAGKSTFLRTVGVNMVLAFAGFPVDAFKFELSVFNISTFMRIKDSLQESTSTFKAELNRLKMILEHAKSQQNVFVLIDEMLRGTNSHDKYTGSKAFIAQMIAQNVPTLFATHDLQLADMKEEYPYQVVNYHFDIQMIDGGMTFDYKIKNGPCTVFNASILLKELGLNP